MKEIKKLVIIGAGVAGLSAGIYGRINGFETEIYEMHTIPGGECTGWKRKDYYFDGCIHWLMGSDPETPLNKVWREVGALDDNIEIINNEIFYSFEEDGQRVNIYRDPDRLESHLKEISPEDSGKISIMCKSIRSMKKMSMPIEKPFDMMNIVDKLKMALPMLPAMKYLSDLEKTTVGEYAARFKSPLLEKALTAIIPPYYTATSLISTLGSLAAGDSGWPLGGSLGLSRRMEERYLSLGGKVYYRSQVDKILVENGRAAGIYLTDGSRHYGDYVISTADGHATLFDMLEGKYLDSDLRTLYSDHEKYPVKTSVQVSLGVNCDLSHYPHTLCLQLAKGIECDGVERNQLGIRHFCYDPTLMPEGKSAITVNIGADFDWWQNLYDDREEYRREKERLAGEVRAVIERHYPAVRGKIEVVDVATPMTYVRYCNAWQGAWMAFASTPEGNIRYIPGNLPGLEHFYLAGQWTLPPGGLPTAVVTGRWVIKRISELEK